MPNTGAKQQSEMDREKRNQSEKGQHGDQKHSSGHGEVPRGNEQGEQKQNPGEHGGHGENGGQTGREGDSSKKNQEQRNDRKKDRGQKNK